MRTLRKNRNAGIVLPVVLILIFCGFLIAAMLAAHAGNSLSLTRRSLEYQRASVLADSGIGYGLMYVKSKISSLGWAKFLSDYRGQVNTIVYDASTDSDLRGVIPNYSNEYENAVCFVITREESGTSSSTTEDAGVEVEISSRSRNKASDISSAVRETISLSISQLGDYAAFYEYDLEVWPGEEMTFKGKVHSNGDLWVGADNPMKFERNVTSAGNFYAQRKPDSGYGNSAYLSSSGRVKFRKGNDDDYEGEKPAVYSDVINTAKNNKRMDYTGIGADKWYSESMSYYGGALKTAQAKLSAPISVADDPHTIIERRKEPGDPGYNADTEAVKFANKACLTIHIGSDGTLSLYDRRHNEIPNPERILQPATSVTKQSTVTGQYNVQPVGTYTYTDEDGNEHSSQPSAYEIDNCIYDRREDKAMQPVDIYVDQILGNETLKGYIYPTDIAEGELSDPGVLYVTRDTPDGYPVLQQTGTREIQGLITNIQQKTSRTLEDGWEEYKAPSQVPLYAVKKPTKYYYYSSRGGKKTYTSVTTYQGTSYTKSGTKYTYDATKTKNEGGSTNVATGKTLDEAKSYLTQHPEYYYVQSGTGQMYNLQKITITSGIVGSEPIYSTNYIPTQACVRLRNASDLRTAGESNGKKRGLSIATDLPLYVEGCFNTDGQKGSAGVVDFSQKHSALVAADAVTMLSSNWKDELRIPNWSGWNASTGMKSLRPDENQFGLNKRIAVETTFNGMLMTGIVESNGGTYSGGLQNLFRFHETWRPSGLIPYNFNGSMICMWLSKIANKPIESSNTYQPPKRPWGWAKMQPPGLPNIMNIQEFEWKRIDPADPVFDELR